MSYKYTGYPALQLTTHVSSNVMGNSSCNNVERIRGGLSRGSRSVQRERVRVHCTCTLYVSLRIAGFNPCMQNCFDIEVKVSTHVRGMSD